MLKGGDWQNFFTVGTDCSGMDTPLVALRRLGIEFTHVFSCDSDPQVKQFIMDNMKPQIYYDDITKRQLEATPSVFLYALGFPCQPFSTAGLQLGEKDPRGNIFQYGFQYISVKRPGVFILENVKGIFAPDHRPSLTWSWLRLPR